MGYRLEIFEKAIWYRCEDYIYGFQGIVVAEF
jgi:hypothetical protein